MSVVTNWSRTSRHSPASSNSARAANRVIPGSVALVCTTGHQLTGLEAEFESSPPSSEQHEGPGQRPGPSALCGSVVTSWSRLLASTDLEVFVERFPDDLADGSVLGVAASASTPVSVSVLPVLVDRRLGRSGIGVTFGEGGGGQRKTREDSRDGPALAVGVGSAREAVFLGSVGGDPLDAAADQRPHRVAHRRVRKVRSLP